MESISSAITTLGQSYIGYMYFERILDVSIGVALSIAFGYGAYKFVVFVAKRLN
jgi:uncharacterized membrane protein YbjE (DUF340 family)